MTLLAPLYSFQTGQVWAKAGEEVMPVVYHGSVVIVETKSGERYPTKTTNLGNFAAIEQAGEKPDLKPKPAQRRAKAAVHLNIELF